MRLSHTCLSFISTFLLVASTAQGQTNSEIQVLQQRIKNLEESLSFVESKLQKRVDDVLWLYQLEDIARVDKVRFSGPPSLRKSEGTVATNEVILHAYTFLPRREVKGKLPLIVLVHGELHGDLNPPEDGRIVRELVTQGYAVIAPEYRGSTGYGRDYWELIDYGGLENDDVLAARNWMLEHHPETDPERVGIFGWSHGGMITLMNIFLYSKAYQAAYAAAPVSDLVARFGYKPPDYKELFSAPYHIGKTPDKDVEEYRRRSPVTHAHKLQSPLLIHAATNDEDVRLLEIERLIDALKVAGKKFDHKIYTNPPGGHYFNRLDTKLARESRSEAYKFLAKYLYPPFPP